MLSAIPVAGRKGDFAGAAEMLTGGDGFESTGRSRFDSDGRPDCSRVTIISAGSV